MRQEPLLLPAVAFAAGIFAAHFNYFVLSDLGLPVALTAVVCALSFVLRCRSSVRIAAVCLVLSLAGIATQVVHRQIKIPKLNVADGETVLLDGCVVNPPAFSPGREQFTAELSRHARIRLSVVLKGTDRLHLTYGQRFEAEAKVRRPRNFQDPEAFDYAGYLAQQHIYWTGSIADLAAVHVTAGSCGSRFMAGVYAVRTWALDRLSAAYPNDPHTLGLLSATLLGETAGVERRWTSEFRATGTYHALVISGLHVWIVATVLLFLLRVCGLHRLKALLIAAIVCWGYALVTGGNAPVIRAAAGYTLFLFASFFFRRTRILNLLAAVGLVYLASDPDALFDPAFQLSFLSAAAIAAFAVPMMDRYVEPLRAAVKRLNQVRYDPLVEARAARWRVEFRLLSETVRVWTGLSRSRCYQLITIAVLLYAFAADAVVISACVQFALALPMIAYFHQLSATGLSANILVVPLLTLVVPTGFLVVATGWHCFAIVAAAFLQSAEWLAQLHLRFEPAWHISDVPLVPALMLLLALIILGLAIRNTPKLVRACTALALIVFAFVCLQPWKALLKPGRLEISAIDVGQGDSLFVAFPNGKTMLIDAGGFPGMERMSRKPQLDLGEDVVSPYLWSRRLHRLDYVVLTHGHSDHMAGMGAVLDNFRPAALLTGAEPETREWRELVAHAGAGRIPIRHLHRGDADMWIGDVRVRVLAPAADYRPEDSAKNDDSLVLELTYGKQRALLTGDAERPVEEDMVANAQLQPVTLLKVGHHGSRTSSSKEFLDQVRPRFAFISDGYMNAFHHPHDVVLKRLAEHHASIWRTDQQGLLTFETDGQHATVTTYR